MMFSEDLGPCVSTWKNPSRTCGYKWDLLKVRKGNTKGTCGRGASGVHQQREHAFLFQVLLKPTLTHGEGRPRRFSPNNERVGRGMGSSQPGVGGLGHLWATYMSLQISSNSSLSQSHLCQTMQKLLKPRGFKDVFLYRQLHSKALLGTTMDRRQTHIFDQSLLVK
jgi:hypothetical protein